MKKLSVDQAIKKGHQMVNYPVFAIFVLGVVLMIYVERNFDIPFLELVGLFLTFCGAWLWWSFMITKWRIWAFENCRNVHELKRRAVNERLIWPDRSFFEKTEIRNREQKKKLQKLEKKFEIEDEVSLVEDDGSIPSETKIHYSPTSRIFFWGIAIVAFLFGVYLLTLGNLTGVLIFIISILLFYSAHTKTSIKEPFIVLNDKGIKLLEGSFVEWEKVNFAKTILYGSGKNSKWYLEVEFLEQKNNGDWSESIEISDLEVVPKEIQTLIDLYIHRHKVKNIR